MFRFADEVPEEIDVQYGDSDDDSAIEEICRSKSKHAERGTGDGAPAGADGSASPQAVS